MSNESNLHHESFNCNFIGGLIMALGIFSGFIFILAFGRIEIPTQYYGTEKAWSPVMVAVGIGIIINSFIIGYLFLKISSILKYQELVHALSNEQLIKTKIIIENDD